MTPDALPDPIEVAVAFTRPRRRSGRRPPTRAPGPARRSAGPGLLPEPRGGAPSYSHERLVNVIHIEKAVKIDVFVAGSGALNAERLRERISVQVSTSPDARLWIDKAEYSVLSKLEWFRRRREVSEREWRDVVAMLRVQGGGVDRERLTAWALRLGLSDLLERALVEADAL